MIKAIANLDFRELLSRKTLNDSQDVQVCPEKLARFNGLAFGRPAEIRNTVFSHEVK